MTAGRMTPAEFAGRAVGVPWRRDAASWDAMNCYGVILLWFRHVLGIELQQFAETELAAGFAKSSGWRECEPAAGATCWMSWLDGAPQHCGVLLAPDQVLHSNGCDQHPGSVRVTRLRAMQAMYSDLRFYAHEPC